MLHLLGIAHGDALLEPGKHLRRKLLRVAMGKRGGQQGRVDRGLHLSNFKVLLIETFELGRAT